MTKKYSLAALTLVVCLLVLQAHSMALTVDKIGALDLGGRIYPEWWYTSTSPTLFGTAEADSTVTITINDEDNSTLTDANGNWAYWLNGEAIDYNLEISQGGETVAFVLHLGQGLPENLGDSGETTESTVPVPTTGLSQIVAIGFGLGVILLASYLYIWGDGSKRITFEKKFLSED